MQLKDVNLAKFYSGINVPTENLGLNIKHRDL